MSQSLKEENFNRSVLENSSKPVVIKVSTNSCHNCKTLAPIFEASEVEHRDRADFFELKADDNLNFARSLKIFAVPTLLFYRHGVLVAKKAGVRSQKSIGKILEPLYNYSKEDAVKNKHKGILKRIFGK